VTTTYNPTDLATNLKDRVRFLVGDTDMASPQLQDEEIAWAVIERGNAYGAGAMCALALVAKYSRLTSISADGVSQGLDQKARAFALLAKELQRKEVIYRATPTLGGASISDMKAILGNIDRVPDIFRIGISDNPAGDGTDPYDSPATGMSDPVYPVP
jgi:hypothetical protein